MARKADVPDAWDDDWEAAADKMTTKQSKSAESKSIDDPYNDDDRDTPFSGGALLTQPDDAGAKEIKIKPVILSRAERLAQHAEQNRKLWETADNPQETYFLSAGPATAGSSGPSILSAAAFRPAMTVLSRKPAPQMIRRRDPVTGLEQLTISDDAAEAEAEARAAAARKQETPEQIRQRQLKEREERQRKYDEARAKIFGEATASPRQTSPTQSNNQTQNQNTPMSPQSHNNRRGRGRGQGQGGQSSRGGNGNNGQGRGNHHHSNSSNGNTSAVHGSASHASQTQKLFDPHYSPKPGSRRQGGQLNGMSRNNSNGNSNANSNANSSEASPFPSRTATPRDDNDFVTRAPKGPDGTGRGGFGFARRGG